MSPKIRRRLRLSFAVTLLYEHRLASIQPVEPEGACRIGLLNAGTMDTFADVRPMPPFKISQFRHRFERGDRCLGAWTEDRLVHFTWIQTKGRHPVLSAGRTFEVAAGQFWLYDARTAEAARGRRLYPHVLGHALTTMRDEGFDRGFIYTERDNLASRKGIGRAGFAVHRRLFALSFGARTIPLVSLRP